MTPQIQNWDTNYDVYVQNEKNMIDWECNMIEPLHWTQIMIEDLPEVDDAIIFSDVISASKSILIDNTIETNKTIAKPPDFDECMIANNSCENVHIVLSNISFIYDPVQLNNNLLECRTVGVFATSIGSMTVVSTSPYVLDVDTVTTVNSDDESDTDTDDNTTITEW